MSLLTFLASASSVGSSRVGGGSLSPSRRKRSFLLTGTSEVVEGTRLLVAHSRNRTLHL